MGGTVGRLDRWILTAALVVMTTMQFGCGSVSAPPIVADPTDVRGGSLPPPPVGGYPLEKPYPLLPGDVIDIQVRERSDLNIAVTVPSDGVIEVWKSESADGGARERLKVVGLTVDEVRDRIADIYQRVLFASRPLVQVSLTRSIPREVHVLGAVANEGSVQLPLTGQRMTLWRAITAAGGPQENADISRVEVARKDPLSGAEISLPVFDLLLMRRTGQYDRDPPLLPNDIVTVPELGRVTIFGNINSPGTYLCRVGMTLTQLIAEAGGLKPFSKTSDIRVIRGEATADERQYTVDLDAVFEGEAKDPRLLSGDRIWIDEDWK